jgi:2OG-Fe(II) oxygenase superfamily
MDPRAFQANGITVIDSCLSKAECHELLVSIDRFRAAHDLPLIHREERGRSLRYSVMDGDVIRQSFPGLVHLFDNIGEVVRKATGLELAPMNNETANLNINITPPGGEYRWHYDRNAVTAILYLNSVAGGEIEVYPNYRIHLGRWRATRIQRLLDRFLRLSAVRLLFGKLTIISACPGLLVIMRGDRTLHSVRRVEGHEERICVVMAFDGPQMGGAQLKDLDGYLYSTEPVRSADPNYQGGRSG